MLLVAAKMLSSRTLAVWRVAEYTSNKTLECTVEKGFGVLLYSKRLVQCVFGVRGHKSDVRSVNRCSSDAHIVQWRDGARKLRQKTADDHSPSGSPRCQCRTVPFILLGYVYNSR